MEALSLSLWSRWLIKRKGENIFWNSGLVSWLWWFLLLFLVDASSLCPLYLLMCLYLIGSKITLNNGSIRDIYFFCQRKWYQVPYKNKRKKDNESRCEEKSSGTMEKWCHAKCIVMIENWLNKLGWFTFITPLKY